MTNGEASGRKVCGDYGAIGTGVITAMASGVPKVAVASSLTQIAWPTNIVTAKIVVLGLDSTSVSQ
jgi:hypothetical protein